MRAAPATQNSSHTNSIQITGLKKSLGDRPVLRALDLTLQWGESLVLFGANGAGKTTLLKVLSTQMRPDSGVVVVAGYDRQRNPESIRRHVGIVSHRPLVYEDLTCLENLVFYARLFGVGSPRERAHLLLDRVGLTTQADHRLRTLSHGMQKRLAIARAIVHQPKLLLLDEPEAGLDGDSLAMLRTIISEWTDAGRTVLMTTHNVELGLSWASKVAVLKAGRIDFQQSASQLDISDFKQILGGSLETTG